jgi:hypothetical protein
MGEKKVVLFIVEGANDQIALANPLENLLSSESVTFQITDGDITSDRLGKNIKAKVGDVIKQHCKHYKLKLSDIIEVVLLIDMDGAYIPPDSIILDANNKNAFYKEDAVLHCSPVMLYETHLRKQQNLNTLVGTGKIMGTLFSIYYFSCNLDHVICNDANLSQARKREEAGRFEENYSDDSFGFINFFHEEGLARESSYPESWQIFRAGENSLKRLSNFNIFLSIDAKSIPRDFSHLRTPENHND